MRLFLKNQLKPTKNTRVTTMPSTWIGDRLAGPMAIGSSPIGSGSARVSPPNTTGVRPRRTAASPMVAMMTATTGRPSSGRSTMRSKPKPKAIITAKVAPIATINGTPSTARIAAAIRPDIITNSPWAKLIASVAL